MAETITCAARMGQWGPWEKRPNLDQWIQNSHDRKCSFCGSMHPEDFEKVLERVLVEPDVNIFPADDPNKIYIHGPDINAIKFFRWHASWPVEDIDRINDLYLRAVRLSWKRWARKAEAQRRQLEHEVEHGQTDHSK